MDLESWRKMKLQIDICLPQLFPEGMSLWSVFTEFLWVSCWILCDFKLLEFYENQVNIPRLNNQNPLDLNGFDFKVGNKISVLILRLSVILIFIQASLSVYSQLNKSKESPPSKVTTFENIINLYDYLFPLVRKICLTFNWY